MSCAVPKCDHEPTMLVEWGHGHGPGHGPFQDWLCTDCAYALLFFRGPKVLETSNPEREDRP